MDGIKLIEEIEKTFIEHGESNRRAIDSLKEEGATDEELAKYRYKLAGFYAAIDLFKDEVYKEEWIKRAKKQIATKQK